MASQFGGFIIEKLNQIYNLRVFAQKKQKKNNDVSNEDLATQTNYLFDEISPGFTWAIMAIRATWRM